MILLKDIAKIEIGRTFRQKIEGEPNGDCMVIQVKDISVEDLSIQNSGIFIASQSIASHHLLQTNDILFIAKGNHNNAVQYQSNKKATVVSLFFIIRVTSSHVLPNYVTWFINSPQAQAYFREYRAGASVGNIKKADLENLPIPIPSLAIQQKITDINQLFQEEQQLTKNYFAQKEKYLNGIFNNLIK